MVTMKYIYNETYKTTRNNTDILWTPHSTTTKKEGIDTNLEAQVFGKNFVFLSDKYSIKQFILFLTMFHMILLVYFSNF